MLDWFVGWGLLISKIRLCADIDSDKIDLLKRGIIPTYEPGIGEYFERNCKEGRIHFEKDIGFRAKEGDI